MNYKFFEILLMNFYKKLRTLLKINNEILNKNNYKKYQKLLVLDKSSSYLDQFTLKDQ
jgi:hypothetical protein